MNNSIYDLCIRNGPRLDLIRCKECRELKPSTAFHNSSSKKGGKIRECTGCRNGDRYPADPKFTARRRALEQARDDREISKLFGVIE